MNTTQNANARLVKTVRAGATRLARAAVDVTDSKTFTRFVERLVRWNDARARMVSEIIGQPNWSDAVEASLRKVAHGAMEGAEVRRKLDRQWEIERLEARQRAEKARDLDDATRQYHEEIRVMLACR